MGLMIFNLNLFFPVNGIYTHDAFVFSTNACIPSQIFTFDSFAPNGIDDFFLFVDYNRCNYPITLGAAFIFPVGVGDLEIGCRWFLPNCHSKMVLLNYDKPNTRLIMPSERILLFVPVKSENGFNGSIFFEITAFSDAAYPQQSGI